MHIGFRRSGGASITGGRGEYEVVGSHSGYTAISLEGWTFQLSWPDGNVRDTGLVLEPAGSGKPRLRSQLPERFQIGRMVAAMCMLPDPRRGYDDAGAELPRIVEKKYVLSRLGFGSATEFTSVVDLVKIDPTFVSLEDVADVISFGIESRWSRIAAIYEHADDLPVTVQSAVNQHRNYMESGDTVTEALTRIVRQVGKSLALADSAHIAGTDALPSLERVLGLTAPSGPDLPEPDRLGEDEPEVSARSAVQYRLAKMRGAAARQFSADVREAYKHRCAFCGYQFGGVPGILTGVDAAHILAWSKHNLDVISNGISLCKLHHWAFDAALVMPLAAASGVFTLHLTTLAEQFPLATRDRLVPVTGMTIPSEWLPTDPAKRPSQAYLERLYADLAVTFVA